MQFEPTAHRHRSVSSLVGKTTGVAAAVLVGAWAGDAHGQGEIQKLVAPLVGDNFGVRVAGVGDLNGDGYADFAIGGTNHANVYSGVDRTVLQVLPSGSPLIELGDLDQDGFVDLAVGAHAYSVATATQLWPIPGGRVPLCDGRRPQRRWRGRRRRHHVGEDPGPVRRQRLHPRGVSARRRLGRARWARPEPGRLRRFPRRARVDRSHSGSVGKGRHDPADRRSEHAAAHRQPPSITFLADVDLDGVSDYAVGEKNAPGGGRVRCFSGKTGTLLWQVYGNLAGAGLGHTIVPIADVNFDGVNDLLVNADLDAGNGPDTSSVSALSGSSGVVVFKVFSTDIHDGFGYGMAAPGDINGDGRPDFVVGEPDGTWQEYNAGLAYVYSSHCWDEFADWPGCPGSNGLSPSLDLTGCLTRTGTGYLLVTGAFGGQPGLLLGSTSLESTPLVPGCTLWLNPATALVILPFGTAGVPVAGGGAFVLPFYLPAAAGVSGFAFQALVADPLAANGFAVTNALTIDHN